MSDADIAQLHDETRAIWDANADYWDERMAEGNLFHTRLVAPSSRHLLDIQPDESVLEIACGNGQFARELARLGARVLATDFSPGMIAHAEARTAAAPELRERIVYDVLDATDAAALGALGTDRFDAVVANMALMDMTVIEPLFNALPHLLKSGGRFVFTVSHPCFNTTATRLVMEEGATAEGEITVQRAVKVLGYAHPQRRKGVAMVGQPRTQWYFDRSLAVLANAAFAAGMVIAGLEEPTLPGDSDDHQFGWAGIADIPPVIAVRLRPR